MDALYTVSQKSGQSFASLAGSLSRYGPGMRVLGYSFSQSAAMMGTFAKAGIPVPRMMMGIQSAATKLAANQEANALAVQKAQTTLANATILADNTTGKEHTAAVKTMIADQVKLKDAQILAAHTAHTTVPQAFADQIKAIKGAKNETDALAIASKTFGARGGLQLVDAIRTGKFNFDEMNKAIKESPDAINATAARTQTLGGAFGKLKNATEVALQPLASKVFTGISQELIKLTKNLTPIVNAMGRDLPKVMKDLTPIFQMISAHIGESFKILGDMFRVAIPILKAVFDAFAVIADLLTGKWSKAWDKLKDLASNVWKAISGIPKLLIDLIEEPFLSLGKDIDAGITTFLGKVAAIPGQILNALATLGSTVVNLFTKAWTHIEQPVGRALGTFWSYVTTIPGVVVQKLWALGGQVWSAMSGGFAQAAGGAASGISSLWRWLSGVAGSIGGYFTNLGTDVWNWISNGFGQAKAGAINGISNIWSWLGGLGGRIVTAVGNLGNALYGAGTALVHGFENGIKDAATSVVNTFKNAIPKVIRDHLPFSPAKVGPLSGSGDPYLAGQEIVRRIALGVKTQQALLSRTMSGALGLPMTGGAALGGGGAPVVVVENAYFADTLDVEAFMKKAAWIAKTQGLVA
jgi:phage-related minor tail protein